MPGADLDAFVAEVTGALGARHVVTDAEVTALQAVDWTGRWQGSTPAVVRPATVDEVASVLAAARRHRVALVPQGGRTGLVGGSVPLAGEVVVDLRRLDRLGPVDAADGQVTAGAGVTLERLQAHAAGAGLVFGVDLGARGTATIGGMVATNAGGNHVVRHGTMRQQVLGVEAVLGTGEVLRSNLAGLVKDNTGYDLPGLLCGSEGTLGIVTGARLRLLPEPPATVTALIGFPDLGGALAAGSVLRRHPDLWALELVLADGLDLVAGHLGETPPVPAGSAAALLVEARSGGPADDLAGSLAGLVATGPEPTGTAVATTAGDAARLWRWREAHPEAAAALGVVHKADVTLPASTMHRFLDEVPGAVARSAPGATTLRYGHLGDGNIHVNVVGPGAGERCIDDVLDLVLDHGGSISAEHGIGIAKRAWLERQRGPVAVAAMRSLKAALDPDGICNPGVLLPT